MAEHSSSSIDPSVAALVGGLINDTKELLLQEFTLAKLEMQGELQKTKTAAIAFAIGAGVAAVGGLFLILMLVHLLAAFTAIPMWGCFGIIGGGLLVIGLLFLMTGKHTAQHIELIPQQTVATLTEDVQWLKEQTTSTSA